MDEVKLLPCPFCGGEARHSLYVRDGYKVQCTNRDCYASTTQFNPNGASKAIERWNTRAIEATRPTEQGSGAIPGSHPTDQAPSGLGASRFDPERKEDAYALEAWAFNVMLECSGLADEQPSEVAIGGAILDFRDLDRILTWTRDLALERTGA